MLDDVQSHKKKKKIDLSVISMFPLFNLLTFEDETDRFSYSSLNNIPEELRSHITLWRCWPWFGSAWSRWEWSSLARSSLRFCTWIWNDLPYVNAKFQEKALCCIWVNTVNLFKRLMITVTGNIHKQNLCYCQMLQASWKHFFFFLCGVGWSLKINECSCTWSYSMAASFCIISIWLLTGGPFSEFCLILAINCIMK